MALAASCDYMNAVNDLIHAYAEYRMLLFLFLVILLMGRLSGIARILVPGVGWVRRRITPSVRPLPCGGLDGPGTGL
jgi:hypothetical protein